MRCFSWFIGELLSSLLARYRFFPLFFTGLFVYDRIRVCPVCYPLQPTNQRGARSLVTFILDAQPSPRALLFLLSSLSLSLFCSLFAILSIASGTSHRVTDPRHLLSAVNCRALEPGLLTFWKFVVSKKQTTNERMNERGPLARRMDCPEFVRSSSHSSAGIIELFVSIYLFFSPVADSTVPIGLCLLIEKGLSVVSNPFNIASNLTTFLKRTAVNVFLVLIRTTQDAQWY